jgi:hypothetical protein
MQHHPPSIEPQGLLDGIRWRAVLFGVVVDTALTVFASGILLLWAAGPEVSSLDEEAAAQAIAAALISPEYLLASLVVGLLATLIGAYAGASRAGTSHVRHGGWIAVCSAVLGFSLYLLPGPHTEPTPPFWYDAVGLALILPAGLLGGLLAAHRNRSASV